MPFTSAKLRVDGQKAKASMGCFWHVRVFFFMKTPENNFSVLLLSLRFLLKGKPVLCEHKVT